MERLVICRVCYNCVTLFALHVRQGYHLLRSCVWCMCVRVCVYMCVCVCVCVRARVRKLQLFHPLFVARVPRISSIVCSRVWCMCVCMCVCVCVCAYDAAVSYTHTHTEPVLLSEVKQLAQPGHATRCQYSKRGVCSVSQCVAVCCRMLHCAAVCCSVM